MINQWQTKQTGQIVHNCEVPVLLRCPLQGAPLHMYIGFLKAICSRGSARCNWTGVICNLVWPCLTSSNRDDIASNIHQHLWMLMYVLQHGSSWNMGLSWHNMAVLIQNGRKVSRMTQSVIMLRKGSCFLPFDGGLITHIFRLFVVGQHHRRSPAGQPCKTVSGGSGR